MFGMTGHPASNVQATNIESEEDVSRMVQVVCMGVRSAIAAVLQADLTGLLV
jgi:hypothetical protein